MISYGPDVERIEHTARENDLSVIVVNARFFKPLDEVMLQDLFSRKLPIFVFETDVMIGGLSSAILEFKNQIDPSIEIIGIHDHFVEHGSIRSLRKKEHIDLETLFHEIEGQE